MLATPETSRQGGAKSFHRVGPEAGRVDVDVRRIDLHRHDVELPGGQDRQNLVGDADPVGEGDVDTHRVILAYPSVYSVREKVQAA